MELGLYTFADLPRDSETGPRITPDVRMRQLIEEIVLADQVGLDVFGIGEHHRPGYAVSSASGRPRRSGRKDVAHQVDECRDRVELGPAAFDAMRSPGGALLVGSPQELIDKILREHDMFGQQRFLLQMSVGPVPHCDVLRAIELFGTEVAPAVRKATLQRDRRHASSGAAGVLPSHRRSIRVVDVSPASSRAARRSSGS